MAIKHKYFEDQLDDEDMLLLFRKHPVVMRKQLVVASVGILVPMLYITLLTFVYADSPDKLPTLQMFFVALGTGFFFAFFVMFYAWMGWYFSVYALTDKRLIQVKQKGFFHRSLVDISNEQISMINYEISGLQETLLGYGTMTIQTYVGELVIKDVHHPKKIQKAITTKLREHGFLSSSQPFTAGPSGGEDYE